MHEISCDICMDLMPLVRDQVASEDSVRAVKHHLESCPECRSLFEGEIEIPELSEKKSENILKKVKREMFGVFAAIMMFGVFYGLSLTNGGNVFLNSLIMPGIGILGYCLFKWRSLWITPVIILGTHLLMDLFFLITGSEVVELTSVIWWSVIYALLTVVGGVIAGLLHFAFKKEQKSEEERECKSDEK